MPARTPIKNQTKRQAVLLARPPLAGGPYAGRTIPEFDYRGVAHRLRLARMVLDLSVAEVAAAAGRSLRTWQKYEVAGTNRAAPLVRFAAKYDVSLDWLVCGKADRIGNGRGER